MDEGTIGSNENLGDYAGGWSLEKARAESDRFLRGLNLPVQAAPDGLGREYDYPSDARTLTSQQLGTLQLQLTGYYTYALAELGREEAELGAFEQVYQIRLGLRMHEERAKRSEAKGTIVKEILTSLAIKGDEVLERMARKRITWQMRIKRLETQVKIYEEQVTRLSREQSRREAEMRVR